jgi:acyl-CoA synthetase (NDP forming)
MEALLGSDEVDLLIVTVIDMATALPELMEAIAATVERHRAESDRPTPVLTYWAAPPGVRHHRQMLQASGVPCYSSTLSTVRVAAALHCQSSRVPDQARPRGRKGKPGAGYRDPAM